MLVSVYNITSLFGDDSGGVVRFLFWDPLRSGPCRPRFSFIGVWVGRVQRPLGVRRLHVFKTCKIHVNSQSYRMRIARRDDSSLEASRYPLR